VLALVLLVLVLLLVVVDAGGEKEEEEEMALSCDGLRMTSLAKATPAKGALNPAATYARTTTHK
jgi:hypothetical protein